jgi:hypothetical protein
LRPSTSLSILYLNSSPVIGAVEKDKPEKKKLSMPLSGVFPGIKQSRLNAGVAVAV